jgi:transposase
MNGKRRYTKKTLVEKAKALQDLDSGMSMRACAAKYSVFVGTIINWKKNKSEIISSIYEFTNLFQKRLAQVSGNGKVIDEKVYEWFANVRCRNIPISGPILQTKAL